PERSRHASSARRRVGVSALDKSTVADSCVIAVCCPRRSSCGGDAADRIGRSHSGRASMHFIKGSAVIFTALFLAACADNVSLPTSTGLRGTGVIAAAREGIPNSYIVTFRSDDDASAVASELGTKHRGRATHV